MMLAELETFLSLMGMRSTRRIVLSFSKNWPVQRMRMASSPTLPSWRNCAASKFPMHNQCLTKKKRKLTQILTLLLVYQTLSIQNGVLNKIRELETADFLIYFFSEAMLKWNRDFL